MPSLSGAETLKAIRAGQGPNQNVPILAFTADSDLSTLGEDHGFDGMVFKPIFALISRGRSWNMLAGPDPPLGS